MSRSELESLIEMQLKREALRGRDMYIRDPTLDGRCVNDRAETLIRAGILTGLNAPQIVPPRGMPLISSPRYSYFNKRVLSEIDLCGELRRWKNKFDDTGHAMVSKGVSRANEGCAWECMCVVTDDLMCFRYYTKRSGNLGRQVVRLVFLRAGGRIRWENCRLCVAGECRPWCSHIVMGFEYLNDIKESVCRDQQGRYLHHSSSSNSAVDMTICQMTISGDTLSIPFTYKC